MKLEQTEEGKKTRIRCKQTVDVIRKVHCLIPDLNTGAFYKTKS